MSMILKSEVVPDSKRLDFLPNLVGGYFLAFESILYSLADRHIKNYSGGYWEFIKGDFFGYVRPSDNRVTLVNAENYFESEMSNDAAGISLTIMSLNVLMWQLASKNCGILPDSAETVRKAYDALIAIYPEHEERSNIYRFID